MNLDESQTARVRAWIDQGLKVSDIQSRLSEEFGLRLTYMEARLLLDDLRLKPKDAPASAVPSGGLLSRPDAAARPATGGGPAETGSGTPGGRVTVSVDEVTRPNALVSGKVTFRDGETAEWQLDQYGRLAVAPRKTGYKPSQADVVEFQTELDAALARVGY